MFLKLHHVPGSLRRRKQCGVVGGRRADAQLLRSRAVLARGRVQKGVQQPGWTRRAGRDGWDCTGPGTCWGLTSDGLCCRQAVLGEG